MSESKSPFLEFPVEVHYRIIDGLAKLSDLHSLMLTSQKMKNICLSSTSSTLHAIYRRSYQGHRHCLLAATKARELGEWARDSLERTRCLCAAMKNHQVFYRKAIEILPVTFEDLSAVKSFSSGLLAWALEYFEAAEPGMMWSFTQPEIRRAVMTYEAYCQFFCHTVRPEPGEAATIESQDNNESTWRLEQETEILRWKFLESSCGKFEEGLTEERLKDLTGRRDVLLELYRALLTQVGVLIIATPHQPSTTQSKDLPTNAQRLFSYFSFSGLEVFSRFAQRGLLPNDDHRAYILGEWHAVVSTKEPDLRYAILETLRQYCLGFEQPKTKIKQLNDGSNADGSNGSSLPLETEEEEVSHGSEEVEDEYSSEGE